MKGARAPHAEAIAALRPTLDAAHRAQVLVARLRARALGADDATLNDDLAADFPGDPSSVAPRVEARAAEAAALRQALADLRHQQHEALHDPAWADLVADVHAAGHAHQQANAAFQALDTRRRHLEAVLPAVRDATTRIGEVPDDLRTTVAAATVEALRDLLTACDLHDAPDGTDPLDWLAAADVALRHAADEIVSPAEAAATARAEAEARLAWLLG